MTPDERAARLARVDQAEAAVHDIIGQVTASQFVAWITCLHPDAVIHTIATMRERGRVK